MKRLSQLLGMALFAAFLVGCGTNNTPDTGKGGPPPSLQGGKGTGGPQAPPPPPPPPPPGK